MMQAIVKTFKDFIYRQATVEEVIAPLVRIQGQLESLEAAKQKRVAKVAEEISELNNEADCCMHEMSSAGRIRENLNSLIG